MLLCPSGRWRHSGGNRPKRKQVSIPGKARSEQGSSSMQRAAPREGARGLEEPGVAFFVFSLEILRNK